jgi:hypothetical protein
VKPALVVMLAVAATPLLAKDRLGAYQGWAAFRDADVPRCYAIASPQEAIGSGGYVSVGFWPKRGLSHQVYARLSLTRAENAGVTMNVGGRRFRLTPDGNGGRASDRAMDMAIIAAMRGAQSMSVQSTGRNGGNIIEAYALRGAASAIDAAALGCAKGA